jgi:hypothetical protein
MIQVRFPLYLINNNILTTTSASIDFSDEDNAICKGNTNRKKLIDDFDIADNEPVSPDVRQRLVKLKDLNDAYNVSDEDFGVQTPSSPKRTLAKIEKDKFGSSSIYKEKSEKGVETHGVALHG